MNNRKLLGRISRSTLFAFMAACAVWAPLLSKGELIHRWSFNNGTADDSVGAAHGTLYGTATITNGALRLSGSSGANRMETAAFGQALDTNKTLVAWFTLDNHNDAQPSGSPLSVVNGDQTLMDAIVYGERVAYQWMNGSDGWQRTTANNGGYAETLSSPNVIMIAIVYNAADAQKFRLYRNGSLYAQHNTGSLIGFDASAKVVIGPRHMAYSVPQGYFNGSVTEARVYDTALAAEQIAQLSEGGPERIAFHPLLNGDFEAGVTNAPAPHWSKILGISDTTHSTSLTIDAANAYYPDPPQGDKMVNLEINRYYWNLAYYPMLESELLGTMALGEAYTFRATAVSTAEDMAGICSTYRFSLWDVDLNEEIAHARGIILSPSTTNFVTFTTPSVSSRHAGNGMTVRLAADGHGYSPVYHIRLAVDDVAVTTNAPLASENGTWVNTDGGEWSNAANWNDNTPGSGLDAVADLSTLALTSDSTVFLDNPCALGHLVFGDQALSHDWIITKGKGGPLTMAVSSGRPSITVNNQRATLAVELKGTQGLTKNGNGTLTLTDARTYQEPFEIQAGTLQLGETLAHRWSFNDGTANDSVGVAHGTLYGTATITNGALRLSGSSGNNRLETAAFGHAMDTEKTLVVWCTLDDNTDAQPSGSPLSVVSSNQTVMDAIVYGERVPYQWMNGSDGWKRTTANNGGYAETLSSPNVIMIAIVYNAADAQKFRLYRNGMPYAQHNEGSLIGFDASAKVVIGPRHLENSVPRGYFNGSITEARVYLAALSAEDVASLHRAGPDVVPAVLPPQSAVAVASGATLDLGGGVHTLAMLSGAGSISHGAISVTSTLAPGDAGQALGTLMVQGDLTLADAAVLNYDYNGAAADSVDVNGTLTIQGTNTVILTAIGAAQPPKRVTLFTFETLVGGTNLSGWTIQGGGLSSNYRVELEKDPTSIYLNIRWVGTIIFVR